MATFLPHFCLFAGYITFVLTKPSPDDTLVVLESCFNVSGHAESFSKARNICKQTGGALASLSNQQLQNRILESLPATAQYWIGLRQTDRPRSQDRWDLENRRRNWTWLDGNPLQTSMINWAATEPDRGEFCGMIWNHSLVGGTCSSKAPFICEKDCLTTTTMTINTATPPETPQASITFSQATMTTIEGTTTASSVSRPSSLPPPPQTTTTATTTTATTTTISPQPTITKTRELPKTTTTTTTITTTRAPPPTTTITTRFLGSPTSRPTISKASMSSSPSAWTNQKGTGGEGVVAGGVVAGLLLMVAVVVIAVVVWLRRKQRKHPQTAHSCDNPTYEGTFAVDSKRIYGKNRVNKMPAVGGLNPHLQNSIPPEPAVYLSLRCPEGHSPNFESPSQGQESPQAPRTNMGPDDDDDMEIMDNDIYGSESLEQQDVEADANSVSSQVKGSRDDTQMGSLSDEDDTILVDNDLYGDDPQDDTHAGSGSYSSIRRPEDSFGICKPVNEDRDNDDDDDDMIIEDNSLYGT